MPRFFNVSGYLPPDTLDGLTPGRRFALFAATTAVVTFLELYVAYDVLVVATLEYPWLFWLEVAFLSLPFAAVVLALRKGSSFFPIVLVALPFLLADFWLDEHVRRSAVAWWSYGAGTLVHDWPPLARTLFIGVADGFFAGPVCLFVARGIAGWLPREVPDVSPTAEQRRDLFRDSWSGETQPRPPRDVWYWIPRLIGVAYFSYLGLVAVGAFGPRSWPGPISNFLLMTYENPALAINTFQKVTVVGMVAMVAAYNSELRWHAGIALVVAHGVSTIASLALWFLAPSREYAPFLLLSAATDAVFFAALFAMAWRFRAEADRYRPDPEYPETFTFPQAAAKVLYLILFVASLGVIGIALYARLYANPNGGLGAIYGGPDPLVSNSITKYGTVALLCWFASRNSAIREILAPILAVTFAVGALSSLVWPLVGPLLTGALVRLPDPPPGQPGAVAIDWQFAAGTLLDGASVLAILVVRRMQYAVDSSIETLSPSAARGVLAIAQGLIFGSETSRAPADPLEAADIVGRTDRYFGTIRSRKRAVINAPFALLEQALPAALGLYPALSAMSQPEQAYWLRANLFRPPPEREASALPPLADLLGELGFAAHGIVMLARYSSPRSNAATGFVPSDARDRLQGEFAMSPPPFQAPASLPKGPTAAENVTLPLPPRVLTAPRVYTPVTVPLLPAEVDYLVVGSGAGGAVAAYRLASEGKGQVLVVEAGARYAPPRDYTDDELEMYGRLYKEGGLQQTKQADLVILQGEAVGGSTVINNGVCLAMPQDVRDVWANDYGLAGPLANLDAAYAEIKQELGLVPLPKDCVNQSVANAFTAAVQRYNGAVQTGQLQDVPVVVNMRDPLGTGLDNVGDRRTRKRSMLETYVPWAEANGALVVSDTTGVRAGGPSGPHGRTATHVLVRTPLGHVHRVKVRKAVVVAAGVIASSHFLQRSGGSPLAGTRVACNFAFPVAFEFEAKMNAFDGTQITLSVREPAGRVTFETYFNPPASFALSLPFRLQHHRQAMLAYPYLANFGALVGSEPAGTVSSLPDPVLGTSLSWEFAPADVANVKYGLKTLVELGRLAGAVRAWVPTEPGILLDLRSNDPHDFAAALDRYPLGMAELRLSTAHPQGGNAWGGSGSKAGRVVDEHFRVEGWTNVYVADASLFPTSIGVNPQWTVMALSSMAARAVLAQHP